MVASDIVSASLRTLNVIAAGQTPSSDEAAVGLDALNRMLASWSDTVKKTLAGSLDPYWYTFVAAPTYATGGTTVSLPVSWQKALIFSLAIDLAAEFGRPIDPTVAAEAQQGKIAIVTPGAPVLP